MNNKILNQTSIDILKTLKHYDKLWFNRDSIIRCYAGQNPNKEDIRNNLEFLREIGYIDSRENSDTMPRPMEWRISSSGLKILEELNTKV
jgi:hypothetical protein